MTKRAGQNGNVKVVPLKRLFLTRRKCCLHSFPVNLGAPSVETESRLIEVASITDTGRDDDHVSSVPTIRTARRFRFYERSLFVYVRSASLEPTSFAALVSKPPSNSKRTVEIQLPRERDFNQRV